MKTTSEVGVYSGYRTVRELVQHRLTEDIQSGRIRPGERLRELDLAERYGVSRNPVREAVRALEGQGIVHFRPNRGAIVTQLTRTELEEIYDVVLALERLAVVPLKVAPSAKELAPLEKACAEMGRARSPEVWLDRNDEFHLALLRLGGRARVCRMVEDLLGALMPYARVWAKLDETRLPRANAEHREILDALANGQLKKVRDLLAQHRLRAKSQIATALEESEARSSIARSNE
ncbi:MAG: GntR family transcriptional regulator [Deltaproteobacteria bacterium]